MKNTIILTTALSFISLLTASETIVIKGSDTLGAKMIPQIAEAYKDINEDVSFEIAAEGSSTGIAAIIDGTADIGMSSRDPKDKEMTKALAKGVLIKTITVAKDGIAVIVNESNPMNNISIEELEMVFASDVIDWSAIIPQTGRISAYTRNTSSGTYAVFQKMAMNSRDYGDTTQKMPGNEQIATEVASNPNGIGYVGLAYINTPGVKVLTVDGELPRSTEYPLARPLYYIVNGNEVLEEDVKRFIEFTFSDEGQDVVEAVHFLRIK